MSSYWDYLNSAFRNPITSGPAAFLHAAFNQSYDNSHGASRFYHKYFGGPLSFARWVTDSAQKAQDTYSNTGKDYQYIDRISGPSLGSSVGLAAGAGGVARMARSLADVYGFEVSEDVGMIANSGYR